jgi:hypothetical protein
MPDSPRDRFELKVPIAGSLAVTGRDVMLVAFLAAIGAGLIGMQFYTFQSFTRELGSQFRTMTQQVEKSQGILAEQIGKAQQDRDQILSLLRLRICSDLSDKGPIKPHLEAAWRRVCS